MRHDRLVDPIEETLPEVPTDVDASRLTELVTELAEMNSDDFSTLRGTDAVLVEFAFAAPNEPAASALADDLLTEGYLASAAEPQGEYDDWTVRGTTPEVSVTEPGLREWVRRLGAYGLDHDGCVLDGWAVDLG